MTTKVVAAATSHPVTLAEMRAHLMNPPDEQDAAITAMIGAATIYLETAYKRAFCPQTHDCYLDEWPRCGTIHLPFGRTQSISAFTWTDDGNTERTWTVSGDYLMSGSVRMASIDLVSEPARIVLAPSASWPSDSLRSANGVRVRGVFGYESAAAVRDPIKHAIKLLVADLFANRENTLVSDRASINITALPFAVKALMSPYEVFAL